MHSLMNRTCVAPSPAGDDRGDGSADAPVATIGRALALGRRTILAAAGHYPGPLQIDGDVEIYGGYEPSQAWKRGRAISRITGGNANRAVTIAPGARVRLDEIQIEATEHAWMGVCVEHGAVATFLNCTIRGGDGRAGRSTALSSWGEINVAMCRIDGGPGAEATAIAAYGSAMIVGNQIDASHIGVNCYGATLLRNVIRAGTYGVYIQGDDVIVRANRITLTPPERNARGIFIVNGERIALDDNTIEGGPEESRWERLRPRSWRFDDSGRDYQEITITSNGLWYHGEASGPSGGPYTGPTQDFDDFLEHEPVRDLTDDLRDEIRAYLRAHLASKS